MGRWAQARKRGRAAIGVGISPPLDGDWSVEDSGGETLAASYIGGAPAGIASWQIRYRQVGGIDFTESSVQALVDSPITVGPLEPETYEVQARWISLAVVSDYGSIKTVLIS